MSNAVSKEGALQSLKLYRLQRCFSLSDDVLDVAISALEEVQKYRAIGTVSEFAELKEKATPKKIGRCVFYKEMGYATPWKCLTCGADQIEADFSCEDGSELEEKHTFCWNCGQKLDWN